MREGASVATYTCVHARTLANKCIHVLCLLAFIYTWWRPLLLLKPTFWDFAFWWKLRVGCAFSFAVFVILVIMDSPKTTSCSLLSWNAQYNKTILQLWKTKKTNITHTYRDQEIEGKGVHNSWVSKYVRRKRPGWSHPDGFSNTVFHKLPNIVIGT